MENLSHSVVALTIGEIVHRVLPNESDADTQGLRRKIFLFVSLICANFPDLDIVLVNTLPEPLGYLLHHRGHTHTFVYLIPQGLLVFSLLYIFSKKFKSYVMKGRAQLLGVAVCIVFNLLAHIGLDSLNSYGIHPFYPFNNNWLYGDLVFIVEPFFWVAFGAPLISSFESIWTKATLALFITVVPISLTLMDYLPIGSTLILMALGGGLFYLQNKTKVLGLLASFVTLAVFLSTLSFKREEAKSVYLNTIKAPEEELVEISLHPTPTQYHCWQFSSLSREGEIINVTRGMLSLNKVEECPIAFKAMSPIVESNSNFILYSREKMKLSELKNLYSENCFFKAWTKFARIPVVKEIKAWDARFQRGERPDNFSTIYFDKFDKTSCPSYLPPWSTPIKNLFI